MLNGLIMRTAIAISGLWVAVMLILITTLAARNYFSAPGFELVRPGSDKSSGIYSSQLPPGVKLVHPTPEPDLVWEFISAIVFVVLGPAALLVGAAGLICWILGPIGKRGGERNRHNQERPDE